VTSPAASSARCAKIRCTVPLRIPGSSSVPSIERKVADRNDRGVGSECRQDAEVGGTASQRLRSYADLHVSGRIRVRWLSA
jgi:hypothetical protein